MRWRRNAASALWGGGDADSQREQRVALVLGLVDRFVYDLGLLLGDRPCDLGDYVAPSSAARLRDALLPLQGGGAPLRPEFGDFAQVRIEGNLLDPTAPVHSIVEFDDHSTRVGEDGGAVARRRRRVRLRLLFDPAITTVLDHRVDIA
jgi:hypothetical protein